LSRKRKSGTDVSDLRVIACGFFLEGYPRYDTIWEAMSHLGLRGLIDLRDRVVVDSQQVDKLHAVQGEGRFHQITGRIRSAFRLSAYAASIMRTARREKADIIYIFPSNFFLTICLGLSKPFHHARVYFDLYTSGYSAAKTHSPGKFKIAEAYTLEFLSSKLADQLICLTPEYVGYLGKLYGIRPDKLNVVRDGIQDIWLDQAVHNGREDHHAVRVLYWGNYLVFHGLDLILDSAEELKDENIEFVFCGKGGQDVWVREEAGRRKLSNVIFKGFIPTTEELIQQVDSADIALGHLRVMHDNYLAESNKLKQGMARGKPVITVWTRQKEDLYGTRDNPVPPLVQIKPGPGALTAAIRELANNRERARWIGENARLMEKKLHSVNAITPSLGDAFTKAL
jgi:glycosyltransferase involved in cell wall biosynthesis